MSSLVAAVVVVAGLLLSTFGSGYALLWALFPNRLRTEERIALSVPFSFALAVLDAALFSQTPSGLAPAPMIVALVACTGALLAIGYYRQPRRLSIHWSRPVLGELAVGAVLVGLAAAWAASSLIAAARVEPKAFTALSVDGASGVPQSDQPATVTLENEEGHQMHYDLEVRLAGDVLSRVDDVSLETGARYSLTIPSLPTDGPGADVAAYLPGASEPYRRIHIGGSTRP